MRSRRVARLAPRRRGGWGCTPSSGVRLGRASRLATLAFEHARASESAGEAAAYIERALADVRSLGKQELDVTGPFYLLVVGLVATDALDLADACLEQALSDARGTCFDPGARLRARPCGRFDATGGHGASGGRRRNGARIAHRP